MINPTMVDNFAFSFKCMPTGPTLDYITVLLKDLAIDVEIVRA